MATTFPYEKTLGEFNLLNAIYADGGGTYLLENPDDVAMYIDAMGADAPMEELRPGTEDWDQACSQLGLTAANDPQRIYRTYDDNGQYSYIILRCDYTVPY